MLVEYPALSQRRVSYGVKAAVEVDDPPLEVVEFPKLPSALAG